MTTETLLLESLNIFSEALHATAQTALIRDWPGFPFSSPVIRAHHAEAAEYDTTKPVKVSGMLTKVEWQNPHVWFYVEVKERTGS